MKLEYDPKMTVSYPYYRCPECGERFSGGGAANHDQKCSQEGYSNYVRIIGPKAVERIKATARREGEDSQDSLVGVSLSEIKEHLPDIL